MNYLIFVFIALFIGVFKDIFKKNILGKIEPIQFIIVFYFFMFLFAQITFSKIIMPTVYQLFLIGFSAFFYALANLFGLRVLKKISISLTKPLSSFENIIILMLGFVILGEMLNGMQLIGMILILLPMGYLAIREFENHEINSKYLILAFLAMTFSAFTAILDKFILVQINSFTYFYFLKLFVVLMLGTYYILFCRNLKINKKYLKDNFFSIFLLAIFTSCGTYSYFYALENPLSNIVIVKLILASSLLATTIFGGKFFHEHDLKIKSVSALFGVIGLCLLVLF